MRERNFADLQGSGLPDGCLEERRRFCRPREDGATELAGGEGGRLAPARATVHGEDGIGHHPPLPGEEGGGEDGSRYEPVRIAILMQYMCFFLFGYFFGFFFFFKGIFYLFFLLF